MSLTNLTIEKLFKNAKLTFLVGAGCSVDKPSCQPAGRAMMDAIIKHSCPDSEVHNIIAIEELRFEGLVEIIRDCLDENLKIIEFYNQCDKPNIQHFFLAEMLNKGNYVMTTNFDCLIEYSLIHSGIPKDQIKVIITREDFEEYSNPDDLYRNGIKANYKIHGSNENIINGVSTKESLITTIQSFGLNKDGLSIFQVEPFKRKLFDNISNGRSIVIMGYSGSDDFDVIPTLKMLENLENIIWIDFKYDNDGTEEIYEINESLFEIYNNLDKTNKFLVDIKKTNNAKGVYRVIVNTSLLLKRLIKNKPLLSSDDFFLTPDVWLDKVLKKPDDWTSNLIALKIYSEFNRANDCRRCITNLFKITEQLNNTQLTVNMCIIAANFYRTQEDFKEAIKYYELAYQTAYNLRYGDIVTSSLNGLANIHQVKGEYQTALKMYEDALQIAKEMYDIKSQAELFNNIGLILKYQGNYVRAINMYENALQIYEQLGNLRVKATILSNIAVVFNDLGNYHEAIKRFNISLEIYNQLKDLDGGIKTMMGISEALRMQGKFSEALEYLNKALPLAKQLGMKELESTTLNNLGLVYFYQNQAEKALELFKKALSIDEELKLLSQQIFTLNNIGEVYRQLQNLPEALMYYEKVLAIADQQNNLVMKASSLNNIGLIYHAQSQFDHALNLFFQALEIGDKTGVLYIKAQALNNIGTVYSDTQKYDEALDYYQKALEVNESTNNLTNKALNLMQIGSIYYMQGKESEGYKFYIEGISIKRQLGISTPQDDQMYERYMAQVKPQEKMVSTEKAGTVRVGQTELNSFRGAQIFKTDSDFLSKLEEITKGTFTLVESIFATTKLGFSVENFRVTGIGLNGCGLLTFSEDISNLTSLKRLVLNSNNFKELPEAIGKLINLNYLAAFNNQLESLPNSIGNLKNLETLQLDKNNIRTLPNSIGDLESLQELNLGENKLEMIPETIGNLISLKTLNLGSNQLTDLPSTIENLNSLQELYIYSNQITKTSDTIERLKNRGVYVSD